MAAWCLDPKLIPEERTIFIPEPRPLVPGQALYIQADDVVLNRLPGLRYVVRLRIVEIQDWSMPPPFEDEECPFGRGDHDDDSDDNNHNRRHPGLDDGEDCPRQHGPHSTRFTSAGDSAPHLGVRRGPTFMSRSMVLVGTIACPFFNDARGCASPASGDRGAQEPEPGDGEGQIVNVVQASVENPIGTALPEDESDAMRAVLSLNRDMDAVEDHSLLADLSLLEDVNRVEANVVNADAAPPTAPQR